MSNCDCLPGKAGGTPVSISQNRNGRPVAVDSSGIPDVHPKCSTCLERGSHLARHLDRCILVAKRNTMSDLPFLKWAGGKRWLASRLGAIIGTPLTRRLVEPFLGSGSGFFALKPTTALLADSNPLLKAPVAGLVRRILVRQFRPVSSRAQHPEHTMQNGASIVPRTATVVPAPRRTQQRLH